MSRRATISTESRNSALNAIVALLAGGYLRIYSGTQPPTPDVTTVEPQLIEVRLGDPAFAASRGGSASVNGMTSTGPATETGRPTWCRFLRADGNTGVIDGTVGTDNANVVILASEIVAGSEITITNCTLTMPSE